MIESFLIKFLYFSFFFILFYLSNIYINYYTILHRVKDEKEDSAGTVIKDCIDSLGQLLTTDYDLPKVEYWVKIEDDAVICLNLFRYDMGVEKFNG